MPSFVTELLNIEEFFRVETTTQTYEHTFLLSETFVQKWTIDGYHLKVKSALSFADRMSILSCHNGTLQDDNKILML